jgi:hypothetical protein
VRRLLAAVLALGALAAGTSGCDVQATPYAATVNGAEISTATLDAAVSAVAENAAYRVCIVEAQSYGAQPIFGSGQRTYDSGFVAEVLSILAQRLAVHQLVERLGLPEPAGVDPVAEAQLEAAFAQSLSGAPNLPPACGASAAGMLSGFAPAYRASLVGLQVDEDALAAHLAGTTLEPASLLAYERAHPASTLAPCLSIIEVSTKADAARLRSQAEAGSSFAALARRHSLDRTSAAAGGAIGCRPVSQLPSSVGPVVSALPVGTVSAPVAFGGSWYLFLVTRRPFEPLASLIGQLLAEQQRRVVSLVVQATERARVQVNPRYGHWAVVTGGALVEPPSAPPSRLVPNPGGVLGPTHFAPPVPPVLQLGGAGG